MYRWEKSYKFVWEKAFIFIENFLEFVGLVSFQILIKFLFFIIRWQQNSQFFNLIEITEYKCNIEGKLGYKSHVMMSPNELSYFHSKWFEYN